MKIILKTIHLRKKSHSHFILIVKVLFFEVTVPSTPKFSRRHVLGSLTTSITRDVPRWVLWPQTVKARRNVSHLA